MCFSLLDFSLSSDDSELAAHAADDCAPSTGYCDDICGPSVYSCAAPSFMMTLITSANARTPEECTHQTHKDWRFIPWRLYRQQEGVQTGADTPEDTRQCKVRICQGRISLHQIQYRLFFNLLKKNPQRLQEFTESPRVRRHQIFLKTYASSILFVLQHVAILHKYSCQNRPLLSMREKHKKKVLNEGLHNGERIWIANLELARRADQLSRAHSQET